MSSPSGSDGRIVAIGGSAGAIEALRTIVARLPAELGAPILVTIHVPADATSALPLILSRSGPLPAAHGVDGELVRPGRIYVAPPDRHLSVEDHVLRVSQAPRANGHRPSVDVMFEGVARTFGPDALGIVLSGGLRDGAAGLAVIVASGGDGIVQDPSEAIVSSMPAEALSASPATVLPAREIAGAIERFAGAVGRPVEREADEGSRGSA